MIKTKKILFFVLLVGLLSLCIPNVNAAEVTTYDDTGKYYFTTTENVESNLYGVTWNKVTGKTLGGDQHVNLFQMKTDGVSSKLVVWSTQYQNYRNGRTTLTKLAANYEKNHPGWKVVAGINADQYIMSFGTDTIGRGQDYFQYQPYYPIIMDGERRFPYTMTATSTNAIAFTNDGSKNGFIDVNNVQGLYLEILDEKGNILSKYPIESVNNTPSDSGTTVWFSYVNQNDKYEEVKVESTNDLYIVSNAELAYMSNSRTYTYKGNWAIDSVFGRGTIDQVASSFILDKGQFLVDTNNAELRTKLGENVRIRVQFHYANEALNNVEYASGYHSIQRLNGVDMAVSGAYNTKNYSRSVFGIKADGTYVLMTADMKRTNLNVGLNGYEINAFLKQNDVVTAYQDDGGGSVTAIWRNQDGGFDLVNVPSDGGERSNLTGLFFVVKDSGASVKQIDATANTLTLNLDTTNADMNKITKFYCTLNGVTKEVINNTVTFDGLDKMTEYSYSFSYDTATDKNVDAMLSGVAKTAKTLPSIKEWNIEIKDTKVLFTPVVEDPDEAFEYIRIVVDGQRYPYIDEPIEIAITEDMKELEYVLTYSYDLQDGKDKVIIEENKVLKLKEDQPTNPDNPVTPPDNPGTEDPGGDNPEKPKDEEKGCKKEAIVLITSLISLSTIFVLLRKRK